MVYDCFQFFNELDILKLRLHTLSSVVDRFVISESTVTFSGDPKPLYFQENASLFGEFKDKIIHNVVDDTPPGNPFERDSFQKCAVKRGLSGCTDDDLILFSDVDEIPNPDGVRASVMNFDSGKVYHFAQRMFYYYFNLEEVSGSLLSFSGEFPGIKKKKWLGSKLFEYAQLKQFTLEQMRFPERISQGIRVDQGGWHFSYMGGDSRLSVAERVAEKVRYAAHQEFNNAGVHARIAKRVEKKRDIFGRRSRFERVDIDHSFPEYLRCHQDEFQHLLLPVQPKKGFFPW